MGRSRLTILIVAALLAGTGLAIAGLVTRGGGDEVVLDVDEAMIDVAPSTVAPRLDATLEDATLQDVVPVAGDGDDDVRAPDADPATDAPIETLSPLAEQLGPRQSAVPEIVAPRPRRPLKIRRTEFRPRPVVLITASGLQGEQPLANGTM